MKKKIIIWSTATDYFRGKKIVSHKLTSKIITYTNSLKNLKKYL